MKKSYSYAELKGKLKVGMKVSADQERFNCCGRLKHDGSNEVEITDVSDNNFHIDGCPHYFIEKSFLMVDLGEPKTLQDLKAGDYIENQHGKRKILARIDDVVCISFYSDFADDGYKIVDSWFTISELEEGGYKPVNEQQPKEYTRDEIAKALNIKVEDLKIKDEK